jgi:peptidyl-prolyl cis-trans isomerase B (cyclophilin B)
LAAKKKTQNIFATAAARTAAYEAHKAKEQQQAEQRKGDNKFALLVSGVAVVVALLLQFAYFGFGPGQTSASESAAPVQNSAEVPEPGIALGREWVGSIEVGGETLSVELDGKNAPQATSVFLTLVSNKFYQDVSCHRLTTSGIFVLQCGDPNGDGTGGPGYNWGPIENAPADNNYQEGVLAMARRGGDGNSMGSQFFIVYKDSPIPADAAGGYTVFGKVTKGLSKLNKIINAGTADGSGDGKPAIETKLGTIKLK